MRDPDRRLRRSLPARHPPGQRLTVSARVVGGLIALAILAEMQATLSGRDARPLRERTRPIHS